MAVVTFPYPSNNMTGLISLIQHTNVLTEGFFATGVLIVIAVISIIITRGFGNERSFAFASFLCFLVGLLFRFMDIISNGVFYITVMALVGSVVWLVIAREQEQPI